MPRSTYLTDDEKTKILTYRESGMSFRQIGRNLNRSHNVVMNFCRNPLNYGQNKNGGPKKKLSARCNRRILNLASNSPKSLRQIQQELQVDVSRATIHRVIRSSKHIRRQKFKIAPRLLTRHTVARQRYARDNMQRNWHEVRLFSIRYVTTFNSLLCLGNILR